jgi:methionine synthase II (cobalamin-independent)
LEYREIRMAFNPNCLATAIGSVPYLDASVACETILDAIPEMPLWPQLSRVDFREQMEIQFSEGLPCVVLDETKERMFFDTSGDPTEKLGEFYENVVSDNLEYFKISRDYGRGIYEMEKRLSEANIASVKFFKSQVTGPITFGLGIVDENKRAIYYNDVFRDVVIKGITMKARWLLDRFKRLGYSQVCFVDEPILSAFGSSTYVSVQRTDVVKFLSEVIDAVHNEDALAGSHCCGNTEWPILIDAGVDIISFDAYEFGETISYYPEQIAEFLEKGGVIAWGIVPTSDEISRETSDSLAKRLEERVKNLAGKGIDESLIWERCLLTPSCGTGTRSIELSDKTFHTLSELSRLLRHQNR